MLKSTWTLLTGKMRRRHDRKRTRFKLSSVLAEKPLRRPHGANLLLDCGDVG